MTNLALTLHPGHGTTEPSGFLHYLTEPVHIVAAAAAVAFLALVIAFVAARLRAR